MFQLVTLYITAVNCPDLKWNKSLQSRAYIFSSAFLGKLLLVFCSNVDVCSTVRGFMSALNSNSIS